MDWSGARRLVGACLVALLAASVAHAQADLTLVETAEKLGGQPVVDVGEGDWVCWRLLARNDGTDPARLRVRDFFDARLSDLSIAPGEGFATGTCAWVGNRLTCDGVVLSPGGGTDSARICGTFTCAGATADLCNAAELVVLDPPPGDVIPSSPCNGCPAGPTCVGVRWQDFSTSTKSAQWTDGNASGCLDPGDVVSFEVTAYNAGADASNATFRDPDPPEGRLASCSWSVGGAPPTSCPAAPALGWALGPMSASDAPIRIWWSVDITAPLPGDTWCDPGGVLLGPDCGGSFALPDPCLPTCPDPDVTATLTCMPSQTWPGEETVVTLTACNIGSSPATNVVVMNPVPACGSLVAGSLGYNLPLGGSGSLTDAADGDGGSVGSGPDSVVFALQDLLGRGLEPGECVELSFRVAALECPDRWMEFRATITGDAMPPRQSPRSYVEIRRPTPVLSLHASPERALPGDVITYTLVACNEDAATGDLVNLVASSGIAGCTTYEPGSLRINDRPMTDAAGDDAARIVPVMPWGAVEFRVARLGPGACSVFTWQARVDTDAGCALVVAFAECDAEDLFEPVESEHALTEILNPLAFSKSQVDMNGGAFEPGDEIEYSLRYCSQSPDDIVQVVVTDVIPGIGPAGGSDCPVSYVAGSMRLQVDGQPESALTDIPLDDAGTFDTNRDPFIEVKLRPVPPGSCFTIRFRVRLDSSCAPADCVTNVARAENSIPLDRDTSNEVIACVGATGGEVVRHVGLGSLIPTGGCEFGQRLPGEACSRLPSLCRVDRPGLSWTMLGEAAAGLPGVTFYEMPTDGCCAVVPSDDAHLVVRKSPGTTDVIVEIVPSCP